MTEKIRVLHVVHRLARSGGERQLVDMVKLMPRGHVLHAVCTLYDGFGLEAELERCGVPIYPLRLHSRREIVRGIWRLQKLILRLKINTLHLWMIDAVLLGRLAHWLILRRGLKCALVISPQGADYAPEVLFSGEHTSRWEFFLKKYLDEITRFLSPQVQIALSSYEKAAYVKYLRVKSDHVKVIHNTTNLSDGYADLSYSERARYQAELGDGDFPSIICVSRLIKRKGQEVLLRALPIVAQRFHHVRVWMIGDGEYRTALEEICRSLKLEPYVKFLGLRSDVKRLLHMADIFVFPTLYEPFGIALVEAMAAGLPCVASRTGAIPEIIEEGYSGLTFTPGRSDELAERIIELTEDPGRCSAMGERGRQIVRQRFDATTAAAAYERIYLKAYQEEVASGG